MKGCAKFLNFIALICFWLVLIATVGVCAATAVVGLKPDLIPQEVIESQTAVTLNGQPITMEMITNYRMPVLIILGAVILTLLLALGTVGKIRKALKEVAEETPFSVTCSKSLNTACVLVVLAGLIGIAMDVYTGITFGGFKVNGESAVQISSDLSFILTAALLRMLGGISEFGRRAPEPSPSQNQPDSQDPLAPLA